jgi:hypothetical protein
VGQQQRLARHTHRGPDPGEREVSHVDDHAEAVHLADHVEAEGGEAAMARRVRLDISQLVDPVVGELDGADAAVVGFLHALDLPFEKVAPSTARMAPGTPRARAVSRSAGRWTRTSFPAAARACTVRSNPYVARWSSPGRGSRAA